MMTDESGPKEPRVCIIGPSVNTDYIGGVATHVKNLKSLSCFRDAVVLDPGSVHSNSRTAIFWILKNIATLSKNISLGEFSHVFINTSIYPAAFIKLMIILLLLPVGEKREIHVFFHGGRFFSRIAMPCKAIAIVLRPIMNKVKMFHFLSRIQLEGFGRLFPDLKTGLYANYATENSIFEKKHEHNAGALKLLFVGRMVREKGVFEIISAFQAVSAESDKVSLTMAGEGPDLAELSDQSERRTSAAVQFVGHVTGALLEKAYLEADVLLLPSYQEGFPYVAIEAMRAGLPIISTNSGALETLVQDGVRGFIVNAKDPDSIVGAINKLMENRELLKTLSANCHSYFIENLSRAAAERYYSQLLDQQNR